MLKRISAARVSAIATAIRSRLIRPGLVSGAAMLASIRRISWWEGGSGQNETHVRGGRCYVGPEIL